MFGGSKKMFSKNREWCFKLETVLELNLHRLTSCDSQKLSLNFLPEVLSK